MAGGHKAKEKTAPVVLVPGQGIKEDFSSFIHHFTERNTLRYEDFAELWKELGMPYLFAGRKDYELRETVGCALAIAVHFFNFGTNNQTKICSIYLLYAVYETQGLYPKARIRVTASQLNAFVAFVDDMASKQHYDFVFVFTRLRMERAFLYVATAEAQGKTKKSANASTRMKEILPLGLVSTFSDLSLELVEDLAVVNEEYYRVKCIATNPESSSTPHPSVDLAKPEFIRDVTRQLARFDNWRKTGRWRKKIGKRRTLSGGPTTSESEGDNASDSDSAPEQEETIGSRRQQIREKAFSTVVDQRRSSRYRKVATESSLSDGPSSSGVKRAQSESKKGLTKKKYTNQEEIDLTNAHLLHATAPSKNAQRHRLQLQHEAEQDKNASSEDSEEDGRAELT
ncbi:snRNA-activating protein complex subunit 1-like [Watersipora subatra]|uniref:snRNA-activating protein complex subunit 1-like n=1 Tax=Watersipora subatra TaxID=2589382 RepID=UPI00355BB0C0